VVLYRFADGRREQPTAEVARLGAFSSIHAALDDIFPGRLWRHEESGWRSDPRGLPEIYVYSAPEDPSQVLCLRIWDAAHEELSAVSSSLGLLAWDPETTRFLE
jgi:hypothetical protein